ncbi:MAG TPA: efflux RND transporter permease subunit [Rhodopila sp.]|uniref:efflux RND transporter permease subunit n=1 Tax=Rhodopila sp. TaxID=2480087 RepID=UPI002C0C4066|nr:efflux RND transporter permease subunit [Rhodopila sp.]HVY18204.1 efflux RND transporter permease subunit [Rhodopila sp.]
MSISTPFIRRPIATSLMTAAIFLAGLVAFPLLPVAPLPNVQFPTLTVTAQYPGASPQTMASTVATPLETEFGQMLPGLSQMTSVSVLGTTQITLQFGLDVDINNAETLVLEAINAAQGSLPKNMPSPPTFRAINPADSPILILAMRSDQAPITEVDAYAENLVEQQLSQLPGVGQVLVGGQQTPSIRVQVDPARLAAMGLTMEDVRTVLTNTTVDNPKGSIDGADQSYTIYANDQLTTAQPYNNVIIGYRNGSPIRIRDVGRAVSGPQNRELRAWTNGKRSILLLIFKQPGANVIKTADGVKAKLPQLRADMPPNIHLDVVSDRTLTIRASVNDVEFTLMLSVALVVGVIFLFLRNAWATIIPSVTIPVALIGTLGVMYLCGFSLDNLSLMGLTIAVGFVVDDAIVMLENIFRHIEEGMEPIQAAITGAGEIGFTIVSISFSLIAVFIPLLLMGGIVGRLFREFAICVSITIVVSALVSLTLTPMMASRFLSPQAHGHGRLFNAIEAVFDGIARFYERTLDIALRFRFATLLVFLATVSVTVVLYVAIPKGFFPTQDTGIIIGITDAAQDASFAQMEALQMQVNNLVQHDPAVASVVSAVGSGLAGQTANNGRMYISLKPWDQRKDNVEQVIARIERGMQNVSGIRLFMQPAQDVSVGARLGRTQYQYTLQDSNSTELNQWAPKILARMQKIPLLTSVTSDQENAGTTETLTYDRDTAARFGVQPAAIDDILYDAFGQREVAQYFTGNKAYYVILEVLPSQYGKLATLDSLYVHSSTGATVPLSAIVHQTTVPVQPLAVNHQSQFPAVTISFNLNGNASLGDAVTAVEKAQADLGVPATVQGSFQGTAQAFQTSLSSEPYLIAAALVTVYIILGILYESYILPLTILSTLPSAGVGALLMLMLFHYQLTVIALIGIILLIGIVKKNGIMMVDFAISAERKDGATPLEAIRQACLLRFRPILMTTMAALLSGLPLMLENGAGSELRKPLGFAMVGGLALSQVLTLYTTPVIYLYLDRFQHWLLPDRARTLPRLAAKLGEVPGD